jgi:hypothetical protein
MENHNWFQCLQRMGDFLDKYPDQGYKRKPLSTIIDLVLSQKSKKIMNNQNDYISIFSGVFIYSSSRRI